VLLKQVADVQALLAKNTAVARQGLRKVLVEGRLACTPITEGNRRGYGFTGRGSFGPLIAGEAVTRQYGRTGLPYRIVVGCSGQEQSHRR